MLAPKTRLALATLVSATVAATACAPRTSPGPNDRPVPADGPVSRRGNGGALDPVTAYASAGFIAEARPIEFIGNVRHLAGPTSDSTLMLVTLSMPNRDFTFASDSGGYRAQYQVTLDLRRGAENVASIDARETVRVASYRESTREDESLVFQQYLTVAPGQYVLAISVRDEGSARNGRHEILIDVPRILPNGLSTPVAVYEGEPRESSDSLPRLVANPRATAIFGRDTTLRIYLEGYGLPDDTPVALAAMTSDDVVIWRDTVQLAPAAPTLHASVIPLPVAELGVGRLTLTAAPIDTTSAVETVRTPVFITFGEEWAISSFDEMLTLLRFYASDARLSQLRSATGEQRATAWGTFYEETDPDPRTPEHEGLRTYFTRLVIANERFGDEGASGWQSDRGEVYVTLGEPDQLLEQGDQGFNQRGRAQLWTYHQHRLQLVFIDQTGFGRWRLTSSSEVDFQAVAQRVRK